MSPALDDPRGAALEPIRRLPGEENEPPPQSGTALCLSGGGYRAMLFHAGVVWRLVDTGFLPKLDRVSSVSGGSITAGVLALTWGDLKLDQEGAVGRYVQSVVAPLRELAGHTIDLSSVLTGLAPRRSIGEGVAAAYRKRLFGQRTLQQLPERPHFIFNATNVDSGALWRFSKPYMADYRVGRIVDPQVEVAVAVAASSAFPPFLSPHIVDLEGVTWITDEGNDLTGPEHRDEAVLSDGGVYDNLGLETAWKRCRCVLVSDAGGQMKAEDDPDRDWVRHLLRVLKLVDNQVRAVRKQQVISAYEANPREPVYRDGAYLGIRSDIRNYELGDVLPCPEPQTLELANTPTRLSKLDERRQERLINWGYALADAALRRHVDPSLAPPAGFPYPSAGVG
jgi:NTE family protein